MDLRIIITFDSFYNGEPGEDDLNTDHRYPVQVHRIAKDKYTVEGSLHDVAVWLMSHYQGDLEDRLYPLTTARLVKT